jgi:DMSO reductase family type II enzyme heme b subunit
MKKIIISLISVGLIIFFGALVYYGLRHARGVPTKIEKIERVTLEVPFINKEIDLTGGISPEFWNPLSAKEIKLVYQLMVLPWPRALIPTIILKAFHNQKDIYFYIQWKDENQDWILAQNKFSDACAIMFPLGKDVQPSSIMMGFLGRANIWQWKASQDREYWNRNQKPVTSNQKPEVYADYYYPFEEKETLPISKTEAKSAVNDLLSIRVGTITPKETHNVSGRGFWKDGVWQVVFKRSLKPVDLENEVNFSQREKLTAFAVWNGSKGDRGGRKSISDWVELSIK